MANSINATSTNNGGLITTGDDSGVLNIQTNETTAISIDASQNATFTNGANLPNTFGFKNRIINGAMMIDQRNAGASVTPTGDGYGFDRYLMSSTASSKYSYQQNAGGVSPPVGFAYYLGVTSLSAYAVSSSDFFGMQQRIEGLNAYDLGWGTANAKTVTLSFWVRSSLTGTFGGSLRSGDFGISYAYSYTINAANTWEQKTITIAGPTSGTFYATTAVGFSVVWAWGCGSTYLTSTLNTWQSGTYLGPTGQTSVVGTNGATFYITGIQLEKGTQATSFDFRPYTTELQLCQRYYETSFNIGSAPAQGSLSTEGGNFSAFFSGGGRTDPIQFKVMKRSSPTITYYKGSTITGVDGKWNYYNFSVWTSFSDTATHYTSQTQFVVAGTSTGLSNGATYLVDGNWAASSEL